MSILSAISKKLSSKNIGSEYDNNQLWEFGPILRRTGEDAIKEWCRANNPKLLNNANVAWHTYTIGDMKKLIDAPGDSSMITKWLNENEDNLKQKAGSGNGQSGLWVPGQSNAANTVKTATAAISDYGYNSNYINRTGTEKAAETESTGKDIYGMGTIRQGIKNPSESREDFNLFAGTPAKPAVREPIKTSAPTEVYHRPSEAVKTAAIPAVKAVPEKQIIQSSSTPGTVNNITFNIGSINVYVGDVPPNSRREKMALELTELKDITPTADVKIESSAAKKTSRFKFLRKLFRKDKKKE